MQAGPPRTGVAPIPCAAVERIQPKLHEDPVLSHQRRHVRDRAQGDQVQQIPRVQPRRCIAHGLFPVRSDQRLYDFECNADPCKVLERIRIPLLFRIDHRERRRQNVPALPILLDRVMVRDDHIHAQRRSIGHLVG